MIEELDRQTLKRNRLWTRQWILRRDKRGHSALLLKELAIEDPGEYRVTMRMSTAQFDNLLEKVAPAIQGKDTNMKSAIAAEIKL